LTLGSLATTWNRPFKVAAGTVPLSIHDLEKRSVMACRLTYPAVLAGPSLRRREMKVRAASDTAPLFQGHDRIGCGGPRIHAHGIAIAAIDTKAAS
jgi:hypothetical protein